MNPTPFYVIPCAHYGVFPTKNELYYLININCNQALVPQSMTMTCWQPQRRNRTFIISQISFTQQGGESDLNKNAGRRERLSASGCPHKLFSRLETTIRTQRRDAVKHVSVTNGCFERERQIWWLKAQQTTTGPDYGLNLQRRQAGSGRVVMVQHCGRVQKQRQNYWR